MTRNPTDGQQWSPNYTDGWPLGAPQGVTIHTMEGYFDPSVDWLSNPASQASAHFCIRRDGYILQLVRQQDRAWHARTSGMYYFGIEHEGGSNQGAIEAYWETPEHADNLVEEDRMLIASAKLTAFLCQRWNIRIQHDFNKPVVRNSESVIAGHDQMLGNDHTDPGPDFPWRAYMRAVRHHAGRL